jgi:hypothetical protein
MRTFENQPSEHAELLLTEHAFSALPGHAPVMEPVGIQCLLNRAMWNGDLPEVSRLAAKLEKLNATVH